MFKDFFFSVVPRILFDGWQPNDFRELFGSKHQRSNLANDIVDMIKVHTSCKILGYSYRILLPFFSTVYHLQNFMLVIILKILVIYG